MIGMVCSSNFQIISQGCGLLEHIIKSESELE